MALSYVYPSQQTLEEIEQDLLPVLTLQDPAFQYFPISETMDTVLRFEQLDNYRGLAAIRGYDGALPKVSRVGAKGYLMSPGVFGEHQTLDEQELTERRRLGSFTDRIDVSDLVRMSQEHLLQREIDRIRLILWTLITTGTFSLSTEDGVVAKTDTFPIQTFTASPAWSTVATATPLADLRTMKLLARGHSVSFGNKSVLFMNATQVNYMLENTNANDIFGRRNNLGATFNALGDDNKIFFENDLPQVQVYDEGYYDAKGVFQLFIPTGKAVLIGQRPNGQPVGNYRMTFNANGETSGGITRVVDSGPTTPSPRKIIVERLHNGGPVIYFPSAVVSCNL